MLGIKIIGLNHQYGGSPVLKDIHLQVPKGAIYGLIGPNGAGKTTCLKLILGLLRKQQGDIFIGEKQLDKHRVEILQKVGSLVEEPSIYAHLNARENLLIWQKIYECPLQNIDKVLELVGLSETKEKKTSKFSLGMKQRLALAIALLNDPELLILDEPTNGLDPTGIIEIRQLLGKLNRELGTTILISSHLLSEVQKLVTHIAILNHGTLLFEGTMEQLSAAQINTSGIDIKTNDNVKAQQVLNNYFKSHLELNHVNITLQSANDIPTIVRHLVKEGLDVYEVNASKSDLETIFMDVIKQR